MAKLEILARGTIVVALSSGRAERAKAVAAEHGVPAAYTHFEEMLDREKPDLVRIATPPKFLRARFRVHRRIHPPIRRSGGVGPGIY